MIYEVDTFLRIHSKRVSKEQVVCPKFQFTEKACRRGLQGLKKHAQRDYEIRFIEQYPIERKVLQNDSKDPQMQKVEDKNLLKRFDYFEVAEEAANKCTPMFFEQEDSFCGLASNHFNYRPQTSQVKTPKSSQSQSRPGLKVNRVQINPFPQKRETQFKRYKSSKRPLTAKNIQRQRAQSIRKFRCSYHPLSGNITKFLRKIANSSHVFNRTRSGSATVTSISRNAQTTKQIAVESPDTPNSSQNLFKKNARRRIFELMKSNYELPSNQF